MGSSFDTEFDTPEYEKLAQLAEEMVYRLPGCADVMVRKAIASAYRDFCKRTCVLKSKREIQIEGCRTHYRISPRISDCVVDCVLSVRMNEREMEPFRYSLVGDSIVIDNRLLPHGCEKVFLSVVCVEVPKVGSENAPLGFVDRYGDAIRNGALCQLFAMSNRPWSDAAQAAQCGDLFESALTETRVRHHSGGSLSDGHLNFIKKGCVL